MKAEAGPAPGYPERSTIEVLGWHAAAALANDTAREQKFTNATSQQHRRPLKASPSIFAASSCGGMAACKKSVAKP